MGCISAKSKTICDHFSSYDELERSLRNKGLESCQLIVGIDFTKSNTWQGKLPYFAYTNLHHISHIQNPYQQALSIMCQSLKSFDDDQLIDAYGFGDYVTTNKSVFSFQLDMDNKEVPAKGGSAIPCYTLNGVLENYTRIASRIQMSGPTSFSPIIKKAISLVRDRKSYHILIIIADGCVDDMKETITAIIEASYYPLSIICIGVGAGPWDKMIKMDDDIPKRKFDNFQFVNFYKVMSQCENQEVDFAKHALMEIPYQYSYIKKYLL